MIKRIGYSLATESGLVAELNSGRVASLGRAASRYHLHGDDVELCLARSSF